MTKAITRAAIKELVRRGLASIATNPASLTLILDNYRIDITVNAVPVEEG